MTIEEEIKIYYDIIHNERHKEGMTQKEIENVLQNYRMEFIDRHYTHLDEMVAEQEFNLLYRRYKIHREEIEERFYYLKGYN